MTTRSTVILRGQGLLIEDLVRIARDPNTMIECREDALVQVAETADRVEKVVTDYEDAVNRGTANPVLDYGVTTGFGEFKRVPIRPTDLEQLQVNILLSHAAGVGENLNPNDLSNYYPAEVVRAVLALRINTFLKGHSGIRKSVVMLLVEFVNKNVIPLVPLRGSMGSSGDLAPLAHLFLVLFKEGRANTRFYIRSASGEPGPLRSATELESEQILSAGIFPEKELSGKEGLALTNGATFSAAMLALAVHDAASLADAADIATAMSTEAILGCARAFDEKIHQARGMKGQVHSAKLIRHLLEGSKLLERIAEVQDPYSVRCAPAVHGASRDAISYARDIASLEINAATDNPLFFEGDSWDCQFSSNWGDRRRDRLRPRNEEWDKYDGHERKSYSAGNFHGQPVALAADFLAIALAELANISERRIQLLLDRDHNRGLPANLIPNAGLNSGFMIAQYCAASLVSENKVLTHPASVDSIPTSSNSEDHNSMATIAARKLLTVLANTRHVLAIELLVASQALEWATFFEALIVGDLSSQPGWGEQLTAYLDFLGDKPFDEVPLSRAKGLWKQGERERNIFEIWTRPDKRNDIYGNLGRGTREAYLAIREHVGPMLEDRVLASDIWEVARMLDPRDRATAPLVARARLKE